MVCYNVTTYFASQKYSLFRNLCRLLEVLELELFQNDIIPQWERIYENVVYEYYKIVVIR